MRTPKSTFFCDKCRLHLVKRNYVIGRGDKPAQVLFIGEAPGASEDAVGIPFFGASGKLLNKIILDTSLLFIYYITNTVFCHPCDKIGGYNREPESDEVFACMPNVAKIFEEVSPMLTVFVGQVAGDYYKKMFKPNITILHPAFLLRSGGRASPHYFSTVRKLKEAISHYVL